MSTGFQSVEKILRSRIFSFLCIRLYVIEKEDSNERNPSGVSFVFIQVSLAENKVFRQAEIPCSNEHGIFYLSTGMYLARLRGCIGNQ